MTSTRTPATVRPAADAPAAGRGAVVRLGALALAGVVAAVLGVWFSRAALPTVLADPGALVRWGLPVTTTLTELAGSLTLGALVLAVGILPLRTAAGPSRTGHAPTRPTPTGPAAPTPTGPAAPGSAATARTAYARSLTLAAVAAGTWTVLSVAGLVLRYASVSGRPLGSSTFGEELGFYVTQVDLGRNQLGIVAVAAAVTALALVVQTPTGAAWCAGLTVVALWQQAQGGHAAGATSHELATSSMFLHLVGAAVWIGALAALAVLAGRLGDDLRPSVERYSVVAGWCFVLVAVSGLVNAVIRLGGLDGLGTRYGVLVLVKAALFVVLGLLGAAHRRAALPRLAAPGAGPGAGWLFWRVVAVEVAVMGAVSGVAVALSSTAPPVPQEPPTSPTPAEIVTGHVLPPEPTLVRWFTEWRWDLLFASAAVAGVVVYVRWVRRLHRRGDTWPWQRTAMWVSGLAVFFWTTSGGPAMYGHVLFSAHMVQHMVLAMVIPLLL
ncbi:cytochrome c oxidase assembly protein, partial [Cellulomonas sp. 179-A 4D5 NHS]|uniref:cytochrome c oxidase assembly protein n=1 Tax=Cellulomonas sp. 179-A 4D5 NHS TaxID=3142378 RepID=UPI0039A2EC74